MTKLVVELGTAVIRIGWNLVPSPIIERPIQCLSRKTPLQIAVWLQELVLAVLVDKPNSHQVIIVANVVSNSTLLAPLAECLVSKFGVAELQLLPAPSAPLSLSQNSTGIVVQTGYSPAEIVLVYEGIPYPRSLTYCPAGLKYLVSKTVQPDVSRTVVALSSLQLTDQETTNIAARLFSSGEFSYKGKVYKPDWKAALFGDQEEEEPNLAYAMLTALRQVPFHVAQAMAANVVLSGSLWNIQGLKAHFATQTVKLQSCQQFSKRLSFCFADLEDFRPEHRVFAGACLFSLYNKVSDYTVKAESLQRLEHVVSSFVGVKKPD